MKSQSRKYASDLDDLRRLSQTRWRISNDVAGGLRERKKKYEEYEFVENYRRKRASS